MQVLLGYLSWRSVWQRLGALRGEKSYVFEFWRKDLGAESGPKVLIPLDLQPALNGE